MIEECDERTLGSALYDSDNIAMEGYSAVVGLLYDHDKAHRVHT